MLRQAARRSALSGAQTRYVTVQTEYTTVIGGREVPVQPLICRDSVDPSLALSAARLGDLQFTRVGTDVQIDYRTIHILVEDTTIVQLNIIEGHANECTN